MHRYKIKNGDTLTKIAKAHKTTVQAIKAANPSIIKDINRITTGSIINIPDSYKYEEIGKAMIICLEDIEKLVSFQRLKKLIGE